MLSYFSDEKVEVDNSSSGAASPTNNIKKEVNGPFKQEEIKIEIKEEEEEPSMMDSSNSNPSVSDCFN